MLLTQANHSGFKSSGSLSVPLLESEPLGDRILSDSAQVGIQRGCHKDQRAQGSRRSLSLSWGHRPRPAAPGQAGAVVACAAGSPSQLSSRCPTKLRAGRYPAGFCSRPGPATKALCPDSVLTAAREALAPPSLQTRRRSPGDLPKVQGPAGDPGWNPGPRPGVCTVS